MRRGRTHTSNACFSAFVRVSFDLSVGRHVRIFVFVPSVVPLKSSSRRCVDIFTAPFFGPLTVLRSRGPRCLLRAPWRRLWSDGEPIAANAHESTLSVVRVGRRRGRRSRGTHPSHARLFALNSRRRPASFSLLPDVPSLKPSQSSLRRSLLHSALDGGMTSEHDNDTSKRRGGEGERRVTRVSETRQGETGNT